MNRLSYIIGLVLLLSGSTLRADEAIQWVDSVDEAFAVAQQEKKLVLLHFWHEQCAPCRRLERFVFKDAQVGRAIEQDYVAVKVNTRLQPEVAERYRIASVPQDLVFLPSGQIVSQRISPSNNRGYLFMLNQIVESSRPGQPANTVALARAIANNDPSELPVVERPAADSPFPSRGARRVSRSLSDRSSAVASGDDPRVATSQSNPSSAQTARQASGVAGVTPDATSKPVAQAMSGRSVVKSAGDAQVINNPFVTRQAPANTQPARATHVATTNGGSAAAVPSNETIERAGFDDSKSDSPSQVSLTSGQGGGAFQPSGGQVTDAAEDEAHVNSTSEGENAEAAEAVEKREGNTGAEAQAKPAVPQNEALSIGLEGFCPVSLVRDRQWIKGDPQFGCIHRGRIYLFVDLKSRDLFLSEPEDLAPTLSGYDPVIFAEQGKLVVGSREHGRFVDGRIVLFASEESFQRFAKNPLPYVEAVQQATKASEQVRR